MTAPTQIQVPAGVVAMTTWGMIQGATAQAKEEMRSFSEKNGLTNVSWITVPHSLVEKSRNLAVRQMLKAFEGTAEWLAFVDGDMVPPPDSLVRLLATAYQSHPWADCVGGYCNLRGDLALPTIDTGTGTWESHMPGRGVLEVIRTGAAFLLCKRHVFERIPEPWFRMRVPARPLDFMAEVDNFARMKMDGKNPFRDLPGRPWEKLMQIAQADPSAQPGTFVPDEVGEDSGFCDRVRNAGMRIVVQTDIVVPHLDQVVAGPEKHKAKIKELESQWLQAVGVTT